jgi:hypothetical protein
MLTFKTFGSLLLLGAVGSLVTGCTQEVPVDTTGGNLPPAGVIRGTVTYTGPPPCVQNGHVVGNAVMLVFDAHNPPPPNGLGVTAANFGVVSGDVLFANLPRPNSPNKICPPAGAANVEASGAYAISPMYAGQYVIQGFFDYTGDFFATFKFRQLPEATDVGGGYLDINQAETLFQNPSLPPVGFTAPTDGGTPQPVYPTEQLQADPNYLPNFLPIAVGAPGPVPATSLHGIPTFTMPAEGYLADDVPVILAVSLPLSRPYFYPAPGDQTVIANPVPGSTPYTGVPLQTQTSYAASSDRPSAPVKTAQNPSGNVDFIPVISFPQDFQVYAQPDPALLPSHPAQAPTAVAEYQSTFPVVQLNAGLPLAEQQVGSDTTTTANVFHMQLGLGNDGGATGGNGGLYSWWNNCDGLPGCDSQHDDFVPESPGTVFRMWPLVVFAKLNDLPSGHQPSSADPQSILAQGTDLTKPIVIIQGITLNQDSLLATTSLASQLGLTSPLTAPDYVNKSNLVDHVSVLVRPSTICMDPRAPDQGGIALATGPITTLPNGLGAGVTGAFSPTYQQIPGVGTTGPVIEASKLTNPQLATIINHNAAGSTNGLVGGCLPTGRYQVNIVYPTGQAWTTPNETGSCAAAEGNTLFTKSGTSTTLPSGFPDPLANGCSAIQPRPVLYSQGTRAVIEITPATDPNNCKLFAANGKLPVDQKGNPTPNGAPFVCTGLCMDQNGGPAPQLDATALDSTGRPCAACIDPTLDPTTTPPCAAKKKK